MHFYYYCTWGRVTILILYYTSFKKKHMQIIAKQHKAEVQSFE